MANDRSWKKLDSKIVYENKWMTVVEDGVIMPNGEESIYAYMRQGNGNFIIPMDDENNIYLIEEYRYPIGCSIIQLVAGCHDGVEELESAKKELYEEIGVKAGKWHRLGEFFQDPGSCTICDPVYLATELDITELRISAQEGDESILRIIKAPLAEVKRMVLDNEITCAMSVAALNLLFLKLDKEN